MDEFELGELLIGVESAARSIYIELQYSRSVPVDVVELSAAQAKIAAAIAAVCGEQASTSWRERHYR